MIFGCDFTGDNLLDSNGDNLPKSTGGDSSTPLGKLLQTALGKISNSTGDILYSTGEYSYTLLGNINTF